MTKFLLATTAICIGFAWTIEGNFSTNIEKYDHLKNTSSPPGGRTGAPGESNCTGCHSGSVTPNSAENVFTITKDGNPVTDYIAGETYEISLSIANPTAKQGFQATVLNDNAQMAGSFSSSSSNGISTQSSNGRSYVGHNTSGTNSTNFPSWNWEWIAPDPYAGEVTFYMATNKTNSNNGSSGDEIHTSSFAFGNSTADVEKVEPISNLKAHFDAASNSIHIKYEAGISGESFVNLLDNSGKSIYSTALKPTHKGLNNEKLALPTQLASGRYFVTFFVNNSAATKSIYIK